MDLKEQFEAQMGATLSIKTDYEAAAQDLNAIHTGAASIPGVTVLSK